MGCCQSQANAKSTSHQPKAGGGGGSSNQPASDGTQNPIRKQSNARGGAAMEEKLNIVFKAKRANVFAENIMESTLVKPISSIPKSVDVTNFIKKALSSNYVFAALTETDVSALIDSMNIISCVKGENIITQGGFGDYFYVIEKGQMSVIVNEKKVSDIAEGKSFGELALLYNSPRQATVRADTNTTLYSLDRHTFRFILSNSSSQKSLTIKKSLSKVTLLEGLTDEQFDKLCDTVEVVPYKDGDLIIKKGEVGNIFYMIKEGTVKVCDLGSSLNDHILSAGDYFGERALLTGEPRSATITAQGPCTIFALDRENFNLLLGPLRDLLDDNMNMRVLGSIKLFEKLTKEDKAKLSKSFKVAKYAAGQDIIQEGETGQTFYIIKDGTVTVSRAGTAVSELQVGKYFGEMALLDDEVRKATCTATTAVECFCLDRTSFNTILASIQQQLSKETSARLESLQHAGTEASAPTNDATTYKLADLKQVALLGSGTFGRVTLVQEQKTKHYYALKTMMKSEVVAHKQQLNVMSEKNIMVQTNHPFILRLFQTFKDPKRLMMLLEFIQGGELFSVLHTASKDGVDDNAAKFYSAGVLLAVEYMHKLNIAYRDMKPENCLIDKLGYPKVVDFGLAKIIKGKSFTLCGTPEYLAPELVLGRGHTLAVDYWAFGILVYEMQTGYSPFSDPQGYDQQVITKNIVSGKLFFPKGFNEPCKEMVKGLLVRDFVQRLGNLKAGPQGIIQSKWYDKFNWDDYLQRKIPAPWVPPIKSPTDTSNFDTSMVENPKDDGYVDVGSWDKDF